MSPGLAVDVIRSRQPGERNRRGSVQSGVVNPNATISVDPKDGSGKRYTFLMASPNMLLKQGMTRVSLKPGDEVTVTGIISTGGQTLPDGTIAASASTVTLSDGRKVFDRAALPASSNVCNWVSATVPPPCPAQ